MITKITLEDQGQDMLELFVDDNGFVVDAQPFQADVWKGCYVPVGSDIDAIAVIQFDGHQITIWNKGIKFYRGDLTIGKSAEADVSNVFDVYRLLHNWGLIS